MMEMDWVMGGYRDTDVPHHVIQPITHSIFRSFCSHLLFPRFRRSTQLRGSRWPGSVIPSDLLPALREPMPLFLTNSCAMRQEVRWGVDDRLSAL